MDTTDMNPIVEVRDATDHEGGENPFYEADKAGSSAFY